MKYGPQYKATSIDEYFTNIEATHRAQLELIIKLTKQLVPNAELAEIKEDDQHKMWIRFSSNGEFVPFDFLVGCDGLRSKTRELSEVKNETIKTDF